MVQFNTSFKRLIHLACVLSVLHQSALARFTNTGSWGEASDSLDLSPSAQVLFSKYPGVSHEQKSQYLDESKYNFDNLQRKIHMSVANGDFIHIEDGEGDDILHNLVQIFEGIHPPQVYLHNGYHKLRKTTADTIWTYLEGKFKLKKPQIFTIRGGRSLEDMKAFDLAEGNGLLDQHYIQWLQEASLANDDEYTAEVNEAAKNLRTTLEKNTFTTVVLKTAPGGIIMDVLEKYKKKVAIIWTGPIRKLANSDGWEAKFNYYRAYDGSDRLLASNIPTIIVSPYVGDARMQSIVDERFMNEYRQHVLDTKPDYAGFKNMATIPDDENAKISYYINGLADRLMDETIKEGEKNKSMYKHQRKNLKKKQNSIAEHKYKEKLTSIINEEDSKLALPRRWSNLIHFSVEDAKFREYCPVDLFAVVVTDQQLQSTVKEVMQVEMKRVDGKNEIEMTPAAGKSKLFVISRIDSEPLENRVQRVIDWMHHGEQSPRQYQ